MTQSASGNDHPHPDVDPHLGQILVTHAAIQKRIAELGEQISADYAGRSPLLIAV
ncbi:MAG: hypothetical protein F2739_04195, partial [Actinobacteria bacterium]|nr:hypothetical protein [Actinomycetota bacterium]